MNNWKRNPQTNLVEGLEYKYKSDGRIDWAAMIPAEYYYPNKERLSKKPNGQEIIDSINNGSKTPAEWGLSDEDLNINLAGFRYISSVRGYHSSKYTNLVAFEGFAAIVSEIDWIDLTEVPEPNSIYNLSLRGGGQITSSAASASAENVSLFMAERELFVKAAQNKAFISNVREALEIPYYGVEELSGKVGNNSSESQLDDKRQTTQNLMDSNGWDFGRVLAWGKKKFGEATDWKSLNDIPGPQLFALNAAMAKAK